MPMHRRIQISKRNSKTRTCIKTTKLRCPTTRCSLPHFRGLMELKNNMWLQVPPAYRQTNPYQIMWMKWNDKVLNSHPTSIAPLRSIMTSRWWTTYSATMKTLHHSSRPAHSLTLTSDPRDLMNLIRRCLSRTTQWSCLIQWWMRGLHLMEMRTLARHQNMWTQTRMTIRRIAARRRRSQVIAIRRTRCIHKSIQSHIVNMFRNKNLMKGKSKRNILK